MIKAKVSIQAGRSKGDYYHLPLLVFSHGNGQFMVILLGISFKFSKKRKGGGI
jgi:hypothetical protein